MAEKRPRLNLVVAACQNRGIGINGRLPWKLKKDMNFFKTITSETNSADKKNVVIMGRKTWTSIPEKFRPLPNRINVILSNTLQERPKGAYLAKNLEDAISMVTENGHLAESADSIFIIGGSSVYKCAMESQYPCRIYLTNVLADFECDTFLPVMDENKFKLVQNCHNVPVEEFTEDGIKYNFEVYDSF